MLIIWLKRILKYTLILLLVMVLAIVSWVGYYYFKEIRPYKPIIENILANADPENRHPPENVVKMIEAEFYCPYEPDESDIFGYASRCGMTKNQIISQMVVLKERRFSRTLHWNLHQVGVTWLINSTFNDNDKNALYSELSYTGYYENNRSIDGLNAYAQFKYKKPLSELSPKQSAELIANLKAPSIYKRNPEKLAERTDMLLKIYETMTGIKN